LSVVNAQVGRSITYPVTLKQNYEAYNVEATVVEHKGKKALRVLNENAVLKGITLVNLTLPFPFKNGVIETQIAGQPTANASDMSRGFVGIAFRIKSDTSAFECIYLRPTNGRAEDQLRRNHSVQYISYPDYPWYKLRADSTGVYESYVDLVPGEWTRIKIEVNGSQAKLYVHRNPQPILIVNDLKLGNNTSGTIGLWVGTETEAFFSEVHLVRTSN
jgi:hypothetical protein